MDEQPQVLTPVQEAFEAQVRQSPAISKLTEKQSEIIKDLEGLKDGQEQINNKVDVGFGKGANRMDKMQDDFNEQMNRQQKMFEDHINTTKDNHKEVMSSYTNLNLEIRDNKVKDVTSHLSDKDKEFKAYKDKVWGMVKMFTTSLLSIVVGGTLVYMKYVYG